MQTNKINWMPILMMLVLGLSAVFFLLISVISGGAAVVDLVKDQAQPASEMITAVVFGFEALIVLLCAWFVLQKARGLAQADMSFRFPFSNGLAWALIALTISALSVGGVVAYQEISFLSLLILPPLTVLVITLPLGLLLGAGSKGIDLGARWRFFGIFGLGMTLSPLVMVMLEVIALIVLMLGALIFVVAQPELLNELVNLATLIKAETNQEAILQLLAPYLIQPGVIAAALFYIAMLVPLIEELLKPLAVWLFAKNIETPAQGFALGLLSGAAFAMLESLNASADGSATWALIVSVRAGTTLLHITASGLVGWGIVSMFRERKILRFIAAYLSASAIHGLWNACALTAGLSSIGYMLGDAAWLVQLAPAAIGGMFTLGVGMFFILLAANRKLRSEVSA